MTIKYDRLYAHLFMKENGPSRKTKGPTFNPKLVTRHCVDCQVDWRDKIENDRCWSCGELGIQGAIPKGVILKRFP